jgi:prolyl-tRNA editing enzyme YbaK/EbsC (Cys-tRNA(Pro) deacylase)
LDRDLLAHRDVWAAAGTPDSVFRTSPSELQRSAEAQVVELKESGHPSDG